MKYASGFLSSAALFALVAGIPANAETIVFKANLTAAGEVPPNNSAGTGTANVSVDTETKKVTWNVVAKDLTGDATAAHLHGPAAEGENAPPAIDISGNIADGSADISDAQIADLQAGKMYINVHTARYPDGEIRGQLTKQ